VLSAILYQRGFKVLHASAVGAGEEAIAFVGPKGAGKSTMASAMSARGYPVLTDDVLAIPKSQDGSVYATAGTAQVKLWPDSLDRVASVAESSVPIYQGARKRLLTGHKNLQGKVPLRSIYSLKVGEKLAIRPMQRNDALIEMVRNSFSYRYLRDQPGTATYVLEAYSSIVRHVPVKVLQRSADLLRMDEVTEAVVADFDNQT
jgi:energy-coupling factor transporter ATP-binding protein EcfA2